MHPNENGIFTTAVVISKFDEVLSLPALEDVHRVNIQICVQPLLDAGMDLGSDRGYFIMASSASEEDCRPRERCLFLDIDSILGCCFIIASGNFQTVTTFLFHFTWDQKSRRNWITCWSCILSNGLFFRGRS